MRARDANLALRLTGFVEYENHIEAFAIDLIHSRFEEAVLRSHGFRGNYAAAGGVSFEAYIERYVEQKRDRMIAESARHHFERTTLFRFEVRSVGNREAANEQPLSDYEVHQVEGMIRNALIRRVV